MHPLARAAAALLDTEIASVTALHGGDLSDVLRLTLVSGARVVVKSGPAPPTEAAMLRAIAEAGAPAPAVLACSDAALVLEDMPGNGSLAGPGWAEFGAALRRLHARQGPRHGWEVDYAFGTLPIRNAWCENWPDFWAQNRLLPELAQLPAPLRPRIERLAARLGDLLPAAAPGLLHGDLWTGNVMADGPRLSALIDPACYFGHGEVDLAMLELFGRPAPSFWEAYGTPPGGWPARRAIYQLWPAIVHLRLFGRGYLPMAERLFDTVGV